MSFSPSTSFPAIFFPGEAGEEGPEDELKKTSSAAATPAMAATGGREEVERGPDLAAEVAGVDGGERSALPSLNVSG
jgi:hypothetical protein